MHARCRNADGQLAALPVSDEVLSPITTYQVGADSPIVLRGITRLTGGTGTDLDAVPTIHLAANDGTPYLIVVNGQFIPVYFNTTAADVTDPGQIQPLDNANFHWTRGL